MKTSKLLGLCLIFISVVAVGFAVLQSPARTAEAAGPLNATANCAGGGLLINVTNGDGPYNVTGTGPLLPYTGLVSSIGFPGPGVWTNLTITETTGNLESVNLGTFDCTIPLDATAYCAGGSLMINVTAGDGPFDVTGTGPNLPYTGLVSSIGFPGPGVWTNLTITETTGNLESVNLGTVDCTTPLNVTAYCLGPNLQVVIPAGDGPFDVTGTGPGLPANAMPLGFNSLAGPGTWTGVTVTETTGNGETTNLGNFTCDYTLTATARCVGGNLQITIMMGNELFNITGTGPGLPFNGVGLGTVGLVGSGLWTNVVVTETTGDFETLSLGNFDCSTPLNVTAYCLGPNLQVVIPAGDGPFNVTGTGPGLPANAMPLGFNSLAGPGTWTGVTVTETTGNGETANLGNFDCSYALTATVRCVGSDLQITIMMGNEPFNITGTGSGLPFNGVGLGTVGLTGPGLWRNFTITETTGDLETLNFGNVSCGNTALVANAACMGTNLQVNILSGDGSYDITGNGPHLPNTGVSAGTYSFNGPAVWSNVTVTETTGDFETANLGTVNCSTGVAAAVVCVGNDLQLSITTGDVPLSLTGTGPGLPVNNLGLGTRTLTGPGTWTGLVLTEAAGDLEALPLGDITCATNQLTVSTVCVGDNLLLSILAGDGPFNVTGTGAGLPLNGVAAGTYTLLGPAAWSNMVVAETSGNLETFSVSPISCALVVSAAPGIPVPNFGLVMITGDQFQPAYTTPNGLIARGSNGAEIWLPADADGNWYDTYVVADVQEVAGEIWLGLFIGNTNWGYVRLADVTVLVPIQGLE